MFENIVCAVSLIVVILVLFDFLVRRFTSYSLAKTIPCAYMYPIIGSTTFLFKNQDAIFETAVEMSKTYKDGFAHWTFGVFSYTTYNADSVEKITTNSKHTEKNFIYNYLHRLVGTGLLTSSGEKWFQRRKLLTPAFHLNILRSYQITMNRHVEMLLDEIKRNEIDQAEGTNLQQLMSRFTLNVICESAMGVKVLKIDELDDYRQSINKIGKILAERLAEPWFILDWAYNLFGKGRLEQKYVAKAHSFTKNIISTRRQSFQANQNAIEESLNEENDAFFTKQRYAMLDTLLREEQVNKIDAAGIQEEVNTFVFEGYDTTMTAITFTLFMLATHGDVQDRLFNEIQALDDDNDRSQSKYLEAVVKETLRLWPPIPTIGRSLGEDTIIDGVKLPAKTITNILVYTLHRNPKYFPDPEKFKPSRFLEGESDTIKHNFAYIPFSAGKRNCIGQKFAMLEIRKVVTKIILNFELKQVTAIKDVQVIGDLILRTKDPIRIKFVPRLK